jgi:hypothetical protein
MRGSHVFSATIASACIVLFLAVSSVAAARPDPSPDGSEVANTRPAALTFVPINASTPMPARTPTPVNIGIFVWDDLGADGRQDIVEPGTGGVTVQLWNRTKTQVIDAAVTNGSGFYSVVAPGQGSFRVRVLLPGVGASFTAKDASTDIVDSDINPDGFTDVYTFASNLISITTIDAGLLNVPATPLPPNTPTRTPTNTPTKTPTNTPTHQNLLIPRAERPAIRR